jgi:CheY-like chemotaxis protein
MGTKLLIVDDEPFTVDMLETFLQINGYETVGAFSGEDGLLMVKVEHPEVVILDLMLPDIEGYEVCQRIRAYPPTASLPVLVLSARAEPDAKAKALSVGADSYMVKPVQFPILLSELKRLLELTRSAAQPTASVEPPTSPATSESPTISPVPPTPAPETPASPPAAPPAPTILPPVPPTVPAPETPAAPPAPLTPPNIPTPNPTRPDAPTPPSGTPIPTGTSTDDDTKPKRPDSKPGA